MPPRAQNTVIDGSEEEHIGQRTLSSIDQGALALGGLRKADPELDALQRASLDDDLEEPSHKFEPNAEETALQSAANVLLESLTGESSPSVAISPRCNTSGPHEVTAPSSAVLQRRKISTAVQPGGTASPVSPSSFCRTTSPRPGVSRLASSISTTVQDYAQQRWMQIAEEFAQELRTCAKEMSEYIELEEEEGGCTSPQQSQTSSALTGCLRSNVAQVLVPFLPKRLDGRSPLHAPVKLAAHMPAHAIASTVETIASIISDPGLGDILLHGSGSPRNVRPPSQEAEPLCNVPIDALRLLLIMSAHDGLKLEMLREGVLPKLLVLLALCHDSIGDINAGSASLPHSDDLEESPAGSPGSCREDSGLCSSSHASGPSRKRLLHALEAISQSLSNLSTAEEFHQWAPLDGLVPRLVAILRDDRLPTTLREDVARSLKNIALDDEIRMMMVDHGAIEALTDACFAAGAHGQAEYEGVIACEHESRGHRVQGETSTPRMRLREQAARGLGNLAVCDLLEDRIVSTSAVSALMSLLAEGDAPAKDAALGSLANLVGNEQMRLQFVGGNGIELLREPMKNENDDLYKHAGWTLASLAVDPGLSDEVVVRGGLHLLIQYARSQNPVYQEEAAWGLANISSLSQHAVPLMEAGAVPPMIALTRSEVQGVRMQALWTLANLAVHQDFRLQISADGAIPALLHCLATLSMEDEHCLVQAARALSNLIVATENRRQVVEVDGIRSLLRCARLGSAAVQEAVTRVLVNLSYEANIARKLVHHGVLAVVASLLASPSVKVQQEAAWVAVNVSLCGDAECETATAAPAAADAAGGPGDEAETRLTSASTVPARGETTANDGTENSMGIASDSSLPAKEGIVGASVNAAGVDDSESRPQPTRTFGEEIVAPLMNLLNSDNLRIQEQVVWALVNISKWKANKMRMIQDGLLDKLVTLGRSTSDEVQAASGQLLTSLGEALTPTSRRAMFGKRAAIPHRSSKSRGRNSPLATVNSALHRTTSSGREPSKLGMGSS